MQRHRALQLPKTAELTQHYHYGEKNVFEDFVEDKMEDMAQDHEDMARQERERVAAARECLQQTTDAHLDVFCVLCLAVKVIKSLERTCSHGNGGTTHYHQFGHGEHTRHWWLNRIESNYHKIAIDIPIHTVCEVARALQQNDNHPHSFELLSMIAAQGARVAAQGARQRRARARTNAQMVVPTLFMERARQFLQGMQMQGMTPTHAYRSYNVVRYMKDTVIGKTSVYAHPEDVLQVLRRFQVLRVTTDDRYTTSPHADAPFFARVAKQLAIEKDRVHKLAFFTRWF